VYKVKNDGTIIGAPNVNFNLFGDKSNEDLRRPPTFDVDYPQNGTFTVIVRQTIGLDDTKTSLTITLDGKEMERRTFEAGEGRGLRTEKIEGKQVWRTFHDQMISIVVPTGSHRIRVDAFGTGRLIVNYTLNPYLDRTSSIYRVYAIGIEGKVHFWIQNTGNTYIEHMHGQKPSLKPQAELHVPVESSGLYDIEWWDTVKGAPTRHETVRAAGTSLTIVFPGTLSDAACKIRPVE